MRPRISPRSGVFRVKNSRFLTTASFKLLPGTSIPEDSSPKSGLQDASTLSAACFVMGICFVYTCMCTVLV